MKKEVTKSLLEIFVITMLLTFSIPTWKNINASTKKIDGQIAMLEQSLEIYELNDTELSVIEESSNFKTANVIVYNSSSINRNGKLLLMYSKLSTLDYNDLKISINGNWVDLTKLLLTINKDYYVFMLDENTFSKYSSKEFFIKFDIKEEVLVNNILGKYFDSNIEIIEY